MSSGYRGPTTEVEAPVGRVEHLELPVVVIGAGPVGLAAAANLVERGLDFVVVEAGTQVGASVAQWQHVRLFSPWRFDMDAPSRRLLEAEGWT
ncbi:MAG: FAD-dependent oxidoreductase, partial [Jiangellaceae bacterium]